jgi:hydroxymethylpyrimidine/phosphomethylpyrimidine kinase
VDLLVDQGEVRRFAAARIPVAGSHGTGCTLSAAITAALAHGEPLPRAVETAKNFLGETLRRSYHFQSPGGGILHALNQGSTFRKNEA